MRHYLTRGRPMPERRFIFDTVIVAWLKDFDMTAAQFDRIAQGCHVRFRDMRRDALTTEMGWIVVIAP